LPSSPRQGLQADRGPYSAGDFHVTSGSGGTVAIVDPKVPGGGSVELGPVQVFLRYSLDLPDIAFGAHTTLAYSENSADTGGTLTMTEGRHAASIALLGNYMAGSFITTADGHAARSSRRRRKRGSRPLLTQPGSRSRRDRDSCG
jgi:hypothetical protein